MMAEFSCFSVQGQKHTVHQIDPNKMICNLMFFPCVRMMQMAQRALAQELLSPDRGSNGSYHLALAQLQLLRGEHNSAEESLREALTDNFQV